MGLFDFLEKKKHLETEEEFDESEFDEDENDNFVVDVWSAVSEKSEYGDRMENLNEYERILFVTQTLEEEVNNGGFSQYFNNSSGDFSNELVNAFTQIGALHTAKICQKALAVFTSAVPTDRDEREELLDHLDCEDVWSECDDAFYDYEDDLEALNRTYIEKHRNYFPL